MMIFVRSYPNELSRPNRQSIEEQVTHDIPWNCRGGYALWLDRWLMHLKILGVLSAWTGLPRFTRSEEDSI